MREVDGFGRGGLADLYGEHSVGAPGLDEGVADLVGCGGNGVGGALGEAVDVEEEAAAVRDRDVPGQRAVPRGDRFPVSAGPRIVLA
ncbi:hypothetical protein [Streptomyces sp. NPDC048565]|uniref:hypothetical protein n=1 Tax=Streptomyces sp. NPDC048565 TaxID=3155266 RepID=UPI00341989F7